MTVVKVWEIFIPVADNKGVAFSQDYHKEWDRRVEEIAGGLTIYKKAVGLWVNYETQKEYREYVIPVRIACTAEEIDKIGEMTRVFYNQIETLVYEVSMHVKSFRGKTL